LTTKHPRLVSKNLNSPALSRVALLAGAAAALPLAAHADIVYSGPQDITGSSAGDGVTNDSDYTVNVAAGESASAFTFTANDTNETLYNLKQVYVTPAAGNMYIADPSNNPAALSAGQAIGNSGSNFITGQGTLQYTDFSGVSSPSGGNWPSNGDQAYLGIEFTDNNPSVGSSLNSVYYGWIDLGVETGIDASYTITGWAYENDGDPILAGAGQVPEPSSLALFALGAAGVLAVRRRKLARAANR